MDIQPLKNRMVHKISVEKVLRPIKKSWWFYIFWTGLWTSCLLFIGYHPQIFLLFGVTVGAPLLLQIALHINYYLHDKYLEIAVDRQRRMITFQKREKRTEIPFEDIEIILRFQGSIYPDPYTPYVLPMNFYHYNVVETKDGRKFKFTDFVTGEDFISPVKSEKKVRFLNFIV